MCETAEGEVKMTPREIKKIRLDLSLTQAEFADAFGVLKKDLQNWEQGVRRPNRAATTLFKVIQFCPDAVRDAVAER